MYVIPNSDTAACLQAVPSRGLKRLQVEEGEALLALQYTAANWIETWVHTIRKAWPT
jgi:hypothetical protein